MKTQTLLITQQTPQGSLNRKAGKALSLLITAARIGEVGGLRSFVEALAECLGNASNVECVVPKGICLRSGIAQRDTPLWGASSSKVSGVRALLWWLYSATMFPAHAGIKILCSTHHVLPFRKNQVVTVHDIRPYFYPDNWVQWFNFHCLLPRALRNCDGILTVSDETKKLMVSIYRLAPASIYVVPNTVDSSFFHPAKQDESGDVPYLLSVGSSWEHKNIAELLRMHKLWSQGYVLKIVAGEGRYLTFLKRLAVRMGIENRVEFLSDIPGHRLRTLYQHCAALVYPSTMEGFGLPPLEAMACGRPVIVSDIALFRELYGSAPIFVRLGEPDSWNQAFIDLASISDERLRTGIVRARSYSQERMRQSLFSALRQIWGESFVQEFDR